jgi:hypothetical protein
MSDVMRAEIYMRMCLHTTFSCISTSTCKPSVIHPVVLARQVPYPEIAKPLHRGRRRRTSTRYTTRRDTSSSSRYSSSRCNTLGVVVAMRWLHDGAGGVQGRLISNITISISHTTYHTIIYHKTR